MTRSQKNLQWVKSKFASLKANLNEAQVNIHAANTQVLKIELVRTKKTQIQIIFLSDALNIRLMILTFRHSYP